MDHLRAGRQGDAILFMTPREKYLLPSIEKATRQPVEQMHLPTAETVNTLRPATTCTACGRNASASEPMFPETLIS